MNSPKWARVVAVVCLLALATIAAQCSEEDQDVANLAGNIIADAAMTMESTVFPEATATPTPTPEPEPTEVGFLDERNDVMDYNTRQVASNWTPGLDLSEVILSVDPETGLVEFRAGLPEIEDMPAFLTSNPYFAFIVAGDADPEGTQPLAERQFFGMGQWHIGCFPMGDMLNCELWVREGNDFTQQGESFVADFIDGYIRFYFPEYIYTTPSQFRFGAAALNPYFVDTLGLDDYMPSINVDFSFW